MPRVTLNTGGEGPLFDIGSYARQGPARRDQLSTAQLELIARTVRRAPEVMVKVLTRGGQDLAAVRRHFSYLDRGGDLEFETDNGRQVQDKNAGEELIEDWDLDLEKDRRGADLNPQGGREPPKLVHKALFSMPAGTPPRKVLEAAKNFAREEFALKHRYAFVLHTDEPHPHVHMVVKALSEQGQRLNIRKATLRYWRREFARHLRALGVEANATDRQVRGEVRPQKTDGIYRAALRGTSTHWHRRVSVIAQEAVRGSARPALGKARVTQTRDQVTQGWRAVAENLEFQGKLELANAVRAFVARMPAPLTDREFIRQQLESSSERYKYTTTRSR